MDPSHFRGLQPPASHVIPGAPGAVGHPTHSGFMDPPAIIPAAFLNDIVTMIRDEFSAQNRFISNQYSNLHSELKENHNEMKEGFRSCTHQTDRILTEQHFQFERKLDAIQKGMLQFHESQMTAIADLGARLGALESLTEASRDALGSKITAISETMGHEFDGFVMMVKNEYGEPLRLPLRCVSKLMCNLVHSCPRPVLPQKQDARIQSVIGRCDRAALYYIDNYLTIRAAFANFSRLPDDPPFAGNTGSEPAPDHIDGVEEALTPNTRPQTNSEVDITPGSGELQEELPAELPPVAVLSDPESSLASSSDNLEIEEQDRLYGRDIPMASTPATEELSDPPNTGTDDITMVPALPLTISLKEIFIASTAERDPSQDPPRQDPPLWDPPLQGSPLRDFPPQDPLFGALSPLTSTDSLGSQNHATPEIEIPAPFPLSPNWASRKRKRSHGRGTLKNPRKGRKSHVQLEQEDASYMLLVGQSEGNHADPSIWPPVIEDATSSQMVSLSYSPNLTLLTTLLATVCGV